MDRCCLFTLVFDLGLFGYACGAGNKYGTISVVGPAFVNREVTLKMTPSFPWGCDVEWRCMRDGSTTFQTMTGTKVERYSEDGSFFFKWIASIEYENADFYAVCSTNTSIGTSMVSLNMKDIVGQCGALVLLSPVVRGANVELGYFPADHYIQRQNNNTRTWKKNFKVIQLRNGSYEEDKLSEYFYKLTVFNFDETDKGTYTLECNLGGPTESVHVYIQERPSNPILGPMPPDFNTTECIYVYAGSDMYCKTDNGTEPVHVALLLGNDTFVLDKNKGNEGLYRFQNVYQHMAGRPRRNVTCQVSNAALETPNEVRGILCNVEKGSPPELTVPEFLDGESSTAVCEVRNAIPAPAIAIHVGTVLLSEVQQTDSFNASSNTFTSQARAAKTNKSWNANEMCCTRQSKDNYGLKAVSICQNINMKFPPSDLFISVNKIHEYRNKFSEFFLNMSCETNESNPPCTIKWSSDNDNITFVQSNSWTYGDNGSYRSVSNVLYNVTEDMAGGTITCATKCDHFPSHLDKDYKIYISETDTSADDDVVHITTQGVQYAVVQRQPVTQRIETQQPRNDDSLTYDELDFNFLQEAHARIPSRRNDTRTDYTIIEFSSTQTPAVEDPVYDNASTKI
ncbi:uncharacterized protein LOC128221027 [Mya arenaria]|uniref:uncharacterized protein LOC128221027 n=1 Tax=Mya arenaria TaxID=6604 RepID=UPI0022E4CAAE|nr:uncharacterized protein LOC128221027 [Mya arenaria]